MRPHYEGANGPGAVKMHTTILKKSFLFVYFANCFFLKIWYNNKCQEDGGVEETSYGLSAFPAKDIKKNKKIAENLLTTSKTYGIINM